MSKPWTAAQHKKYSATMRAKREAGIGRVPGGAKPSSALVYLKHARAAMNKQLRNGEIKEFSQAHLLTLLALNVLEEGDE